jgi:hypothetical protein
VDVVVVVSVASLQPQLALDLLGCSHHPGLILHLSFLRERTSSFGVPVQALVLCLAATVSSKGLLVGLRLLLEMLQHPCFGKRPKIGSYRRLVSCCVYRRWQD